MLQMIREHHSTLVFGNSRRHLIERLLHVFRTNCSPRLKYMNATPVPQVPRRIVAPRMRRSSCRTMVRLPKEIRLETEQALKRGEVDAVLAT